MTFEKQMMLLQYIAYSSDVFSLCLPIIQPCYFDTKLQYAVAFLKEYFQEFHNVPPQHMIKAETGIDLIPVEITRDQIAYCCNEVEKFCKQQAMKQVLISAPQLLATEDYGAIEKQMQNAITLAINRNLGQDYFEDAVERARRLLDTSTILSTCWDHVDDAIQMRRGELLLVTANSGGGKSLVMGNLAFNYMVQGLNVLYISLELSEDRIGQRIDSIITKINPKQYNENVDTVLSRINEFALSNPNKGTLKTVRLKTGVDCNTIRAYLKEYELHFKMVPDVIIVDYMGRMKPNDKRIHEEHKADEAISDELREIAVDYDALVITGSQQNRDAVSAKPTDIGQNHIAGGMAKINPTDATISVIFTDTMKFAGEIAFKIIKARNSEKVGQVIWLNWDNNAMRITHRENNNTGLMGAAGEQNKKLLDSVASINDITPQQNSKGKSPFLDLLNSQDV